MAKEYTQEVFYYTEYNLEFNTLSECAEWFVENQLSRNSSIAQVAKSIRYSLNHRKIYQKIKIDEREKVVYGYYE